MVKFINFKVVGGVEDGAGTLNPGVNGNNLLLIERIIDVDVEIATDGTMQAIFNLTSESGVTTCNVICSTSKNDIPKISAPISLNYIDKLKEAINRTITCKPGGKQVDCIPPQDTASSTAFYNPELQVYWRAFNIPAIAPNVGPPLTDATIGQAVIDAITLDPVNASIPIPTYGLMADWNTSQVTNMNSIFSPINGNWPIADPVKSFQFVGGGINNWDTRNVTSMISTFRACSAFNESLANWDTGKVTNMTSMFTETQAFQQPLNSWDVSKVEKFDQMFMDSIFNQDLDNWDVSSATQMTFMFSNTFNNNSSFAGNVTTWDVSNVGTGQAGIGFQSMFENCKNFNQDISGWNVGNGPGFSSMFYNAQAFNQDLSSWNMSKATTVRSMFQRASTFNQDLSGWNAPLVSDCRDFDDLATSWTLPKPSFPASSFCP